MITVTQTHDRTLSHAALRLLEGLHAQISRRLAVNEMKALSDTTLRDVGLERHEISARIDLEMSRIGRLGLGR